MKTKELIEQLQQCDGEKEVYVFQVDSEPIPIIMIDNLPDRIDLNIPTNIIKHKCPNCGCILDEDTIMYCQEAYHNGGISLDKDKKDLNYYDKDCEYRGTSFYCSECLNDLPYGREEIINILNNK
ncbi:MAG: hypothetical protein PHY08_10095 [Candidatus Cloacimonetes bacterium]|nr:hypothetical protein [Candidatus Cloacimonadota bacterium]